MDRTNRTAETFGLKGLIKLLGKTQKKKKMTLYPPKENDIISTTDRYIEKDVL